ncbi:STT3 domain-containing protein [Helicobacter burdigaliensis]|uniref:STT3 domain-containing protein n=1 Tax=Helicobacter burdigaliensis TaxID=2315334 RepID=UPI000EF6954C|nr:STT3 domain-containing protein [Helicobacter burdigaliensis]
MQKRQINFLILMFVVYFLSIGVRFVYLYNMQDEINTFAKSSFILNNHDGYFYAEGARDLLEGVKNTSQSPTNEILSLLSAFLTWLLPFNLEAVIFFMSGILGSLVVFPLMILTKKFGNLASALCGFFGAITTSYYNRTIFGYFDTDMLILPFALAVFALIYFAFYSKSKINLLVNLVLISFGLAYYPSLRYIFIGYFILFVFFVFFYKKAYLMFYAFFMGIVLLFSIFKSPFYWVFLLIFIILSYVLKEEIFKKREWIFYLFFLFFIVFAGIKLGENVINSAYISKVDNIQGELKYYAAINTIYEVSNINFSEFVYRVSGGYFAFFCGILGFAWLLVKDFRFVIGLPLLALGVFALIGGMRYTFYAVPIFALGVGVFMAFMLEKIWYFKARLLIFILLASLLLVNSFKHIINYTYPFVFTQEEINVLQKIPQVKGDYALTWWDYGYPVRYFSKLDTFVDGGNNTGMENYPISFIFMSEDEILSAKLAKMLLNGVDFNRFLEQNKLYTPKLLKIALRDKEVTRQNNKNLYIIVPLRMLEIINVIRKFSAMDLKNGTLEKDKFFLLSAPKKQESGWLSLNKDISLHLKSGKVKIKSLRMEVFLEKIFYQKDKKELQISKDSRLAAIVLEDGRILLCDSDYLKTFYFRAMFYEDLNKDYFTLTLKNDKIKVYKLNF